MKRHVYLISTKDVLETQWGGGDDTPKLNEFLALLILTSILLLRTFKLNINYRIFYVYLTSFILK
jgi:hypothetical protein